MKKNNLDFYQIQVLPKYGFMDNIVWIVNKSKKKNVYKIMNKILKNVKFYKMNKIIINKLIMEQVV